MFAEEADAVLARELAQRTGRELVELRERMGFADPRALRREGDARAHRLLSEELARQRPQDAVLSEEGEGEEGPGGSARLHNERVWIVDPLDGTREYAEAGREDWAVHVALWVKGELPVGAVALPAQGLLLEAAAPPSPRPPGVRVRIAVSRTRAPKAAHAAAEALDAELVPMGSAGAKTAAVLLGTVDAYVHSGGQYEWDSAAPVAVARAAGLHASRIDGAPLRYNNPDPRLDDLLVCRRELAQPLLAALAKYL